MTLRPALVQMPLESAMLCGEISCATVSNDSSQCPRCGSQVLSIARALNREPQSVLASAEANPQGI